MRPYDINYDTKTGVFNTSAMNQSTEAQKLIEVPLKDEIAES